MTLKTKFRNVILKTLEKLNSQQKIEKLNSIALINMSLVDEILEYNNKNHIGLYRMPTNLLPFPTHPISKEWNWREILKPCFEYTGKLANSYGIAVSFHADEYSVINSPNETVFENSRNTLIYLSDILDYINIKNPNIVIHIGGTYGDKPAALERFVSNFSKLPEDVRLKLVIENDDKQYDWKDTLMLSQKLGIPMVLDIHHYSIYNNHEKLSHEDIKSIFDTWGSRKPKIHVSSPLNAKSPNAHADYININNFLWYLEISGNLQYNVMVEAKAKELAVARFINDLNSLGISTFGCNKY